jgi:hypothetical protein
MAFGQSKGTDDSCNRKIEFKYVVVQNSVTKERNASDDTREMWIFLDERAFSEENLRLLFEHVGKKYSSPGKLYVWVETHWDDVPNSDLDCKGYAISEGPDRADEKDHHRATYFRTAEVELFRYNPKLKSSEIKTVVLRGKDIGQE